MNAALWIVCCATGVMLVALVLDRCLSRHYLLAKAAMWNAVVVALVALPPAMVLSPRLEVAWLPASDEPAAEVKVSPPAPRPLPEHRNHASTVLPAPDAVLARNPLPPESPRQFTPPPTSTWRAADFLPGVWQALGLIYGLGVALMLARLFFSWRAVQSLRRGAAYVVQPAWRSRLEHWKSAVAGLPVELAASDAVDVPMALGVLRPAIVLPADVATSEDPRVIDAVLLHELAHIARRDCGWQLLAEVARALWWFHPLVWLSLARMALAREAACDDFAIHHLRDRDGYCLTLLDMASRLTRRRSLGLAMAVVRTNQLSTRLAAIQDSLGSQRCQLAAAARRPLFALAALTTFALASVSLVRAQADPPAESPATQAPLTPPDQAAEPSPPPLGQVDKPGKQADPQGNLSLSVELLGVDGKPVRDGWVLFYREAGTDDPREASDWIQGSQRWRHVHSDAKDNLTAKSLRPGTYRCITLPDFSRIFGYAIGPPIELDGSKQHTTTTLRLQPGATVTMRAVDSVSGEPIRGARLSVKSADDQMPQGNYNNSPPEATSTTFHHLPLGRYRYSAERMANRPDQTDYPQVEVAEPAELTATPEELVVKLVAKPRTEAETLERWPFVVKGVVRDQNGQPMPGATVGALQQVRWLPVTGHATTDDEGRYTLRFGPGLGGSESLPAPTIIEASRPGYSETNMNRQGGLTMALKPTEPTTLPPNSFPRVILPEVPQTIDFALTPAANIDIEILDERNEPARDKLVWLMGNELPPLADELSSGRLNDAGEFHIDNVPINRPWFISVQWREAMKHEDVMMLRTPTFVLPGPGDYRVQAKYEKHPATGLDQLRILRVLMPSKRSGTSRFQTMQRDVTEHARTSDPLWLAPLPEDQQKQGREILRKLAEANRHWLGRPIEAVQNYQYEFHRLEDKPGEYHVDTIQVDKPETDGLWFVHGITYSPLLVAMAKDPSLVVFQLVEVNSEKIRLVYSLTKPLMMQAGNGIEHSWRGYFSNNRAHHGELVIEASSLRLLSHKTDDWTETFADYVEVVPGHAVPRHIKIDHGDMKFDWKFKVYEPGLWLFDSSHYSFVAPDERVVYTDHVQINGQPAKEMP